MLVLTRREGEELVVQDQETGLVLLIVKASVIRGDRVRLGVQAKRPGLRILRKELADAVGVVIPDGECGLKGGPNAVA